MPCLPMAEACRLAQDFQDELEQVGQRSLVESQHQLDAARQLALAKSIFAAISMKVRVRLREAFDELAVHRRLKDLRELRRCAGTRRMVRALALHGMHQVQSSFLHWADSVAADTQAALSILVAERKRAREKAVNHGVLLLAGILHDAEQTSAHEALFQLSRHAEGVKRRETPATRFLSESEKGWNGRGRGPVAALSQRLHVGGRLLQVAIRHMQASRRESALRTWSMVAARCQQAEVKKLGLDTAELNQVIEQRCKQVVVESRLQGMVLSIRAAQLRRCLFTFLALASATSAMATRSTSTGRGGLKAGSLESGSPLRLSAFGDSPPRSGPGKEDIEAPSKFSAWPQHSLDERVTAGGASLSCSPVSPIE